MKAIASAGWLAALICGIANACAAQAPPATGGSPPETGQPLNQPVPVTLTCAEFKGLLKSGDKQAGGLAILWLDGYYAGRSGLGELPAGWVRTVSQGLGGICAIRVNEGRTVLDVIEQIHPEYGSHN
ncbi:MAG: hypothetical protein JO096_11650 [Alphaproteobacteria bacterium]|nr:hypothetical protein [Alphaproteobacteria bacterium]